ncbi:MAG: urease accessory protein UreD [Betaproteobacteria bacterium]|nr:urease accessory protein UreD [Betaproteobacteria bacterium]
MPWNAKLKLDYAYEGQRSVVRFLHSGPLRILQSLYPEGDAVCHNVLVHPPGGLVGGDQLDMTVCVGRHAHGLVTTPGAARFYRSEGAHACQNLRVKIDEGARLEWLPLETLAYSGCLATNQAVFELAPGAELITWDVTALGLPAAGQAFERGCFSQHLEIAGVWLEKGCIDAEDDRLMNGPLGLAGMRCLSTLVFASGSPIARPRRDKALELVRTLIDTSHLKGSAGATSPHPQVLVVRVLSPLVEPAMDLLKQHSATWRTELWGMTPQRPRNWIS